jgi:hypothetical protein
MSREWRDGEGNAKAIQLARDLHSDDDGRKTGPERGCMVNWGEEHAKPSGVKKGSCRTESGKSKTRGENKAHTKHE